MWIFYQQPYQLVCVCVQLFWWTTNRNWWAYMCEQYHANGACLRTAPTQYHKTPALVPQTTKVPAHTHRRQVTRSSKRVVTRDACANARVRRGLERVYWSFRRHPHVSAAPEVARWRLILDITSERSAEDSCTLMEINSGYQVNYCCWLQNSLDICVITD